MPGCFSALLSSDLAVARIEESNHVASSFMKASSGSGVTRRQHRLEHGAAPGATGPFSAGHLTPRREGAPSAA